jgi:pyruvate formate lyase activating enzyme
VEEDSVFYQRSGGGLTISGGEALGQPAFALELLKEAKKRRLNVALETSGAYGFETLAQAALYVDELFYDLKHWDEAAHLKGVGLGNREIVATLRRLAREFPQKKIVARVPVVPGFNDSLSDLKRIKALAPVNKDGQAAVEFLPYHRLGEIKYAFLGRPYPYKGVRPDQAKFESLKDELVG